MEARSAADAQGPGFVTSAARGTEARNAPAVWTRALAGASDGLDRMTEIGCVAATVAFAVVMLLGIVFRYALNDSLSWSDELALLLFVWATFFSTATAYRHGRHIRIDQLVESLSPSARARVAVVAEGLSGGYLVALLVSAIHGFEIVSRARSAALEVPQTVPFAAIPVAAAVMLVHWARQNAETATWPTALAKLAIAGAFFAFVYLPIGAYVDVSGAARFSLFAVLLLIPMLIGVPVAFALGLFATGYVAVHGSAPFDTLVLQMFFGTGNLTLMAIPLLILAGTIMHAAGIAERIVDFAQVLVGRVRGGLGASDVVASLLFGDISGSAVSDTAAVGAIMIPEMKRRGYRADFCAALQGTAGTLGMLAPISITVLLYATAINVSVSRLAAAMILPALLTAASFILWTYVHSRRHNYPVETVPRALIVPRVLKAAPGLFAGVLVVGGVVGGIFTPAEVGAILLAYVTVLSVLSSRRVNPRRLYRLTIEAGYTSGMTLLLVASSAFLGFVLARGLVSVVVVDVVSEYTTSKYFMVMLVNLAFIVLGMGLEAPAMIFGFLPSFIPLLQHAGIDLVHFGAIFSINMGIGMLVPPVALNLFVSTELAGVRYGEAVRAAVPFIIIMIVDLMLVAFFPAISLFLPNLFFGHPIG